MKYKFKKWVIAFLLGSMGLGAGFAWAVEDDFVQQSAEELAPVLLVLNVVDQVYVKKVERQDLVERSLQGMLRTLDHYSEYLSPQQYAEHLQNAEGHFVGIGIEMVSDKGHVMIVTVYPGAPAAQADLNKGDEILEVAGVSVKDLSFDAVVDRLCGAPETKVSLKILRHNRVMTREVLRRDVAIQDVGSGRMYGTVGYVNVVQFQKGTAQRVQHVVEGLLQQGATALVLDLRNNPGGVLEEAVDVCGLFLRKNQEVVTLTSYHKNQNKTYRVQASPPFFMLPLVVLVNGGTASAAEVVAGSLRFHRRTTLVGERSFGKGSVQTLIPLPNGGAVRLTTYYYQLPGGHVIEGSGLTPDKLVRELRTQDAEDVQILTAVQQLQSR